MKHGKHAVSSMFDELTDPRVVVEVLRSVGWYVRDGKEAMFNATKDDDGNVECRIEVKDEEWGWA